MSEYLGALDKTPYAPPKDGAGFSVLQSIEDSRKRMRDQYINGLVSDTQLQDFECSLDARLADYREHYTKASEKLRSGQETACSDSQAKSTLLRQEEGTSWDMWSKVRSLKNLPKDMIVGEAKGISKGATAMYEGTEKLLVGTGEFIGVWAAKWVHEWTDSFLGYANEKTEGIRKLVQIAGEAIAITAFEAANGDRSVIMDAIQYWKEKGVKFSQLPAEEQVEALYAFQTQIALSMVGSQWLWAVSKTATLSETIQAGGKILDRVVSGGARIGTEALGLDSSVLGKTSVSDADHSSHPSHAAPDSKFDHPFRIKHEIQGTTLFIKDIPPMSPTELERELIHIMRDHPTETIRFDESLSSEAKRVLSTIISKNHQLVEVARLLPGNDVVNITFAGIKKLNDTYGQDFTDRLMGAVRARLNGTFHGYVEDLEKLAHPEHARGIRTDDYKNFTVSLPPDAPIWSVLFSGADSKHSFIQEMIEHARQDIDRIAHEKGQTRKEVEDMIRTHLGFGVGKSSVPGNATDMEKLHALYEAEMNSRTGLQMDGIQAVPSDPERTVRYAKEAMSQEKSMLQEWKEKWFTFEWIQYPAIVRLFTTDKSVIHPQLLRQARKWPEAVGPAELAGVTKNYIDTLNHGFDFIVPSHNLEEDFRKAHAFNADFHNGIIRPEAILQTFKGTLTKEAFFGLTQGKQGMRAMIDIKDMGLANLESFRTIAEKVATGNYTREDLLDAGKEVTEQFIAFVETVRHDHPGAQISLGGDEVYLFFEGAASNETESVLNSLHNSLGKSGLEGRISHSFDPHNSRELFAQLDRSMNLHKKVEASIEEILNRDLVSANLHKTISVHADGGISVETDFLAIIKGVQVRNAIGKMVSSIKKGEKLIHETLQLDNITLDCDYSDGMFQFNFSS